MLPDPFAATACEIEEEVPLPITFYACQWKVPCKRKDGDAKISDLTLEKHMYACERKHHLNPIKDFDPRPPEFRGTLSARLPQGHTNFFLYLHSHISPAHNFLPHPFI